MLVYSWVGHKRYRHFMSFIPTCFFPPPVPVALTANTDGNKSNRFSERLTKCFSGWMSGSRAESRVPLPLNLTRHANTLSVGKCYRGFLH